jgi:hypothetical protein
MHVVGNHQHDGKASVFRGCRIPRIRIAIAVILDETANPGIATSQIHLQMLLLRLIKKG